MPKKKKPCKKVTQTWQYKGTIQQQEKNDEHMERPVIDGNNVQKENQEIENEEEEELKQTPELNLPSRRSFVPVLWLPALLQKAENAGPCVGAKHF